MWQKRPNMRTKEPDECGKTDLIHRKKGPTDIGVPDMQTCQKSPINVAKETYYAGKRALLTLAYQICRHVKRAL